MWAVLASTALWPQNREATALTTLILNAANGQPGWLTAIDVHIGAWVGLRGLAASLLLAAALGLIAVAVWLPRRVWRAVLVLAIGLAAVIWVVGEAFGGILTGQGTDPNTGPLLALLALAFWPASVPDPERQARLSADVADSAQHQAA